MDGDDSLEPEPEPAPAGIGRPRVGSTVDEVNLRVWAMSFNMECGDPFKEDGLNDEQLHAFVPKDCDIYVVGLQEAGGEISQIMPSPTAPHGTTPDGRESLYNAMEMFLLAFRSCRRLRHTDTPSGAGLMEEPAVAGRGDQSMINPKYTSLAVYVREELLPNVRLQASCAFSFGVTVRCSIPRSQLVCFALARLSTGGFQRCCGNGPAVFWHDRGMYQLPLDRQQGQNRQIREAVWQKFTV
eukprot:COSAG05_NODE_3929_length_1770_cov_2.724716_1_plen_240_part_10